MTILPFAMYEKCDSVIVITRPNMYAAIITLNKKNIKIMIK